MFIANSHYYSAIVFHYNVLANLFKRTTIITVDILLVPQSLLDDKDDDDDDDDYDDNDDDDDDDDNQSDRKSLQWIVLFMHG